MDPLVPLDFSSSGRGGGGGGGGGGGSSGGGMQSVYTIQGSASPKAHRDAEDEIAALQKSFVELLGHQQGHNLFRMIQDAPQTFVNDDRPMVQRLVRAIERYRAGQEAHQAMISEIGTQIDVLQDRVTDTMREQNARHQQQLTEVVASQDDKLADLETKLYSLGNGVADLEQQSTGQIEVVRGDVEQMSRMLEEAGGHLRELDDTIVKQQHLQERCLNELEEKINAKHDEKVEQLVTARQAVNDKVEGTLQTVGRMSAVLDMHKQELEDGREFRRTTNDAIVALRSNAEEFARTEAGRVAAQCDGVEKKVTGEIAALRTQLDSVRPELGRTHALVERLQGTVDGIDNRRESFRDDLEQLRSAMSAIGHEQHERTNTLAQTLAKMAEEQKAMAARVSKVEAGLKELSSSTQQIIGGISQLMSGFALRGSSSSANT